jgi:hypothetical protein
VHGALNQPTWRRVAGCAAAGALLVASCGGRTGRSDAYDSPSSTVGGDDPTACLIDGVRFCGFGAAASPCGSLDTSACPGGCTPAIGRSGLPSSVGVCWSDLPDKGTRPCTQCRDGEVCVYRATDELICVDERICRALWAHGAEDVCRYADKSAYDRAPVPSAPAACPAGLERQTILCGPCGTCGSPACIGRSPRHPIGVCPNSSNDCSVSDLSAPGKHVFGCAGDELCGVFRDAAGDTEEARRYGLCMSQVFCDRIAAALPGGFDCLQ